MKSKAQLRLALQKLFHASAHLDRLDSTDHATWLERQTDQGWAAWVQTRTILDRARRDVKLALLRV